MKEILFYFIQAIPVLLYWASLVFIGLMAIRIIKERWLPKTIRGVSDNIPLLVLLGFATSTIILGVFSVILYIFKLPAFVYTVFYLALLIVSITYGTQPFISFLRKKYTIRINGLSFWVPATIVVGAILLLLIDYCISTLFGAQFAEGSDSYVHVARILSITQYGFIIDDSFLRGVVESRYHFNAIYALYVPIVQLLKIIPADAWSLSVGFFRLIQWIALGALAYFMSHRYLIKDRKIAYYFSVSAVIIAMTMFGASHLMHVAMYPNKVVFLWQILLMIGLLLHFDNHQRLGSSIAIMSAALITLTHPTYSLMTAIFICLALAGLLVCYIFGRNTSNKRFVLLMSLLLFVLMVSPIITAFFPNRMTAGSFNFGDFTTTSIFGIKILILWIPETVKEWLIAIIQILGYSYLLFKLWRSKKIAVFTICLVLILFTYLTINNPAFMVIVQGKLPIWLLARFGAMNVFQFISLPLGLYVLCIGIYHIVKSSYWRYVVGGIVLLAFMIYSVFGLANSYRNLYSATKGIDHGYLEFIHRTSNTLGNTFKPGSLVVANLGDSYFFPASLPVKVVAIHEAHATPDAASKERLACQAQLFSTLFDKGLLRTIQADYIVLAKWDLQYKALVERLNMDQSFKRIQETQEYMVYKIVNYGQTKVIEQSPCYKYQKIEGTL
jgi:hypothetical protein